MDRLTDDALAIGFANQNVAVGNGPSNPAVSLASDLRTLCGIAVLRDSEAFTPPGVGYYNWRKFTTWRLAEPAFPEQPPVVTARSISASHSPYYLKGRLVFTGTTQWSLNQL